MTDPDFVNEMRELLGEECDALLSSYGQKAFSALRINRLKAGNKLPGFTDALRKVPWAKDAFYYDDLIELKGQGDEDIKSMAPGRHPFHEAGLYYIQEPSAMAPVTYLDVKRGERVLDLCAAPGGKSCQIADALNGKGILISNEINVSRAGILSENIERLGIGNALVLSESPDALAKRFPCFFDRVLVDAPCSGEGMMRKREEARKEWSLDNVRLCAKRQDDILREAAKMLRYGGRMVYSTCTFNKEENEGTIERFLDHHPDFCMENIPLYDGMTHGIKEVLKAEENACGMARIFPHRADGEGHFIAVLKKKDKPGIYTGSVPAGGFEQGIPVKDRKKMTELYEEIANPLLLSRRITIGANHLISEEKAEEKQEFGQMDLFSDFALGTEDKKEKREDREREKRRQKAVLEIQKKYGKNAILKGMNLEEGATTKLRNEQIGGHKA